MQKMTVQGSSILRYPLVAAAIGIVIIILQYSSQLLAPIFLAATFAILFTPALRWLEKKGLPGWLALLVMVVVLGGFIILMVIVLTISMERIIVSIPQYAKSIQQRTEALTATLKSNGIDLQATLKSIKVDPTAAAKAGLNIALGVLGNIVNVIFFLMTLFLMLAQSKSIATKFQTRQQKGNTFAIQFSNYTKQIQKEYRIQATSNLLSAAALTILFLVFGIDGAFVWGFLAFVLGFIPNVGLIIACLPAFIIAFIVYGLGTALLLLALGVVLNAAMDNLVMPRLMGKGLDLSMLLVFLSFLFWTWVFGFLGALLAVPATLFVKTLLQGRQGTSFLVVLLSKQGESDTTLSIPAEKQDTSNAGEKQNETSADSTATAT